MKPWRNPKWNPEFNPGWIPKWNPKWNFKWNPKWKLKEPSRDPHERLKHENVANTMQVRGWDAKIWQIPCKWKANMAKCSKYQAKCKVTMPKCSKYHAKWQVLVPNCCKYKANGTGKESQKKTKPQAKKSPKTILRPFKFTCRKPGASAFHDNAGVLR